MSSILQAIARGEGNAMNECLLQYRGMVTRLARRYLRQAEDVEDAVQDVFVDVWRSADRFDPALGGEASFVLTVARRRLIDRLRRRSRRLELDAQVLPDEVPAAEEPDRVALDDEFDRAREAMRELRPEQRRVLELSLLEGQSHSQIAAGTSLPLGTVKTHARRGLSRLRGLLGVA
ncbi:MAG: sigma-70 family RNA polymerase sigma factor [Planctomycetota bacterium]